jgi:hypothetical protein
MFYRNRRGVLRNKPKAVIKKKVWRNFKRNQNNKNIIRIVKNELARNIENKCSGAINSNTPILKWPSGQNNPEWVCVRMNDLFDKAQGTSQSTRVGNSIKLKRWVIKGTLHPNQEVNMTDTTSQYLRYSLQGYATLYLLRKKSTDTVQAWIQKLYQDGASYADPTGSYIDHMMKINTDSYKVYWSRRFKLGPSSSYEGTGGANRVLNNNDFKLTADFGLDITKYIGKNKIIKYEDGSTIAQYPPEMKGLVLCCVWSPPFGNMGAAGQVGTTASTSFYNLTTSMYYEYEDA